jgi:transglutaminase-like putative cysteine protease
MIQAIIDFFKNRTSKIEELKSRVDELRQNYEYEKNQSASLMSEIVTKNLEIEELKETNEQLFKELNQDWDNPHSWPSHTVTMDTVDGLRIPPNAFIQHNDRKIKESVKALKKNNVFDTAKEVEKYVSQRTQYFFDEKNYYHPGYKEFFQTPSMTWHSRMGDCDDQAILFASIMGMLGYKNDVVVCCGMVTWNGSDLGHAWPQVFYQGEWHDFDSNALQSKAKVDYPYLDGCWYFFNSYNNYKIGEK